jgi:hypothetical protein
MKYIIGAYASAPSLKSNDKLLEIEFYNKLINAIPQIKGLEIPFFGKEIHKFGSDFLLNYINPEWNNILTSIPGVMENLSKNPHFGLASDNYTGRLNALDMYKRANELCHKICDLNGDNSIIAVQIVTAPSVPVEGVSSSRESLLKSMEEILFLDWRDSKIVIEHVDSCGPDLNFEKGFLTLEDEIEVLLKLSNIHNVGITINWARSAIEGKNSDKPLEHIKLALKYNLLSGLIFSGTSKDDENYGSWSDSHMPFAESYDVDNFERNSLLTYENIFNTLKLIDLKHLDYLGIKLLSDTSDMDRRVGLNKDAIYILENIISEL